MKLIMKHEVLSVLALMLFLGFGGALLTSDPAPAREATKQEEIAELRKACPEFANYSAAEMEEVWQAEAEGYKIACESDPVHGYTVHKDLPAGVGPNDGTIVQAMYGNEEISVLLLDKGAHCPNYDLTYERVTFRNDEVWACVHITVP